MADVINDMIIISSGQTVSDLNVGKDGFVEVESGGTLATATVNQGGWVTVSSGGTATGISENGGYVEDKEGAVLTFVENTIESLELSKDELATVHESTTVNSATVNPGGWLIVYSGGSAAAIRENGGYVDDRNGANVTFAANTIESLVVSAGQNASIHDPTIVTSTLVTGNGTTGGWLNVYAGANVSNITVTSAGQVDTDGFVSSVTVNSSGYINVRGGKETMGGLMNFGTIDKDGVAVVYYRGNGWNTIVNDGGRYLVYGGAAAATTVASGGYFVVQAGYEGIESSYDSTFIGGASNTLITGGTMRVVSSGVAEDVTMIDGYLSAFAGGVVDYLTMSGGSVLITGMSEDTGAPTDPPPSGDGDDTEGEGGGTFNGAGTLTNLTMSGGYTEVESGGAITTANVLGGSVMVRPEGTLTDAQFASGAEATILGSGVELVLEGGTATVLGEVTSAYLSEGAFVLSSGAVVNQAVVCDGFEWDAPVDTVINDTYVDGGTVTLGGSAFGVSLERGSFTVLDGGMADDVIVYEGTAVVDGASAVVHSATVGYKKTEFDPIPQEPATLNVINGGFVENLTVADDGTANLGTLANVLGATTTAATAFINASAGATIRDVTVNCGTVNVAGILTNILLLGGKKTAPGGGAFPPTLPDGAELNILSGGTANNATLNSASATIADGGVLIGATLNNVAQMTVSSGGLLTGQISIYDDKDTGITVSEGGVVHFDLSSATTADPARITGLKRISGAPTYTLTVNPDLGVGAYRLADNAGAFNGSITVQNTTGDVLGAISLVSYIQVGLNYYILRSRNGGIDLSISAEIPSVPQTAVYVNPEWSEYPDGTVVVISGGTGIVGFNAFASPDVAADNVLPDGVITILGGTVTFDYGITRSTVVAPDAMLANSVVNSGVTLTLDYDAEACNLKVEEGSTLVARAGTTLTGYCLWDADAAAISVDGEIVFDVTDSTPETYSAQVWNLSKNTGSPSYTLYIGEGQEKGVYTLAYGAEGFSGSITVKDEAGLDVGTLTVAGGAVYYGGLNYTLRLSHDGELSLKVAGSFGPANSDVDGNGVSDVMFVWSGYNYQHGYWMNGTDQWRTAGSLHPPEWENLGCYDMTGDGRADSVLIGNVEVSGVKGAYIGYYIDGDDNPDGSTWVNIDYLNNEANVTWINKIGNLTGNTSGTNSIVWYAPDLFTLGAWTDGTSKWTTITGSFGGDWTLVGCGDFNGDGKDSVLMTAGGALYYSADLDGTVQSMGYANWSGWEVRAIGDFAGDGRDDLVMFHQELGSMVMLIDGNLDNYTSIGQLDAIDWFVVGAGDYNGDERDDLLVRQYSTGMLGYYSGGDVQNGWVELGRGVDLDWTVIA